MRDDMMNDILLSATNTPANTCHVVVHQCGTVSTPKDRLGLPIIINVVNMTNDRMMNGYDMIWYDLILKRSICSLGLDSFANQQCDYAIASSDITKMSE